MKHKIRMPGHALDGSGLFMGRFGVIALTDPHDAAHLFTIVWLLEAMTPYRRSVSLEYLQERK